MHKSTEGPYQILIVDDEVSICSALAMGLASQEFIVDVATNGEAGVKLAYTGKYDLLIVDLWLPDMTGIEVIKIIKSKHPEIISLIITANLTEEDRLEARENGAVQFMEKPFTLTAIRHALVQALAERDAKKRVSDQHFKTD